MSEELIICGATFGNGSIKKDITARLIKDIKDNKINKRYSHKTLGDPLPGQTKEIAVIYKSGGRIYRKSFQERTTPDREILVILPEVRIAAITEVVPEVISEETEA